MKSTRGLLEYQHTIEMCKFWISADVEAIIILISVKQSDQSSALYNLKWSQSARNNSSWPRFIRSFIVELPEVQIDVIVDAGNSLNWSWFFYPRFDTRAPHQHFSKWLSAAMILLKAGILHLYLNFPPEIQWNCPIRFILPACPNSVAAQCYGNYGNYGN